MAAADGASFASPSSGSVEDRPDVTFRLTGAGLRTATMREPSSFTIETLDAASGARVATGGQAFFVSVRGVAQVRARIIDHDDGTYTCTWQPPQSGKYTFVVNLFGRPIPGCPFNVSVYAPEPSALHSIVRGDALHTAHSQKVHTFDVSFRDNLGAVTRAVDIDVFVEPAPPSSPRARGSEAPSASAAKARQPGRLAEDSALPQKGDPDGDGDDESTSRGASDRQQRRQRSSVDVFSRGRRPGKSPHKGAPSDTAKGAPSAAAGAATERLAVSGVLRVSLRKATGLDSADLNGKSDPYALPPHTARSATDVACPSSPTPCPW